MLRRYVTSTLSVCAFAGAVTLFGQEQKPAPPPPSEPSTAKETVTGCVQEAKTTSDETVYVLNKAQGGSAAMYVLAGPAPSELASHVNHKVEVTGEVRQPAGPPPEDKKVLRPPTVQVESVKMVAESCQ